MVFLGVTLKQECVKRWAKSLHACNLVLQDLDSLRHKEEARSDMHKEEMPGRIKADLGDRVTIRNFLATCIHPLDASSQDPDKLVNIYSGAIANSGENVNRSLDIGRQQMYDFQRGLPEGFRTPLKNLVVPMKNERKN